MMIGVSLPMDWLCGKSEFPVDLTRTLQEIKARGVRSVELRAVRSHTAPDEVASVAALLWENGFSITVHASPRSAESAVADVFAPLSQILGALKQPQLIVTVHPIVGDNAAMLRALIAYAEEQGYPIRIALENNRLLPDGTEGDSAALVLSAVTEVAHPDVGICFDLGHYMYYWKRHYAEESAPTLPKKFWKHVIHTHIHALHDITTHYPIKSTDALLKQLLDDLSFGYFGLYNVELDFKRFADKIDPQKALLDSIESLREIMPVCARLYDDLREHFDERFLHALTMYDRPQKGTQFALLQSASFLFQTDGFRWGMDVTFRNAYHLAKTPHQAPALLSSLDLMVISHGHGDHFEEQTVRALAETNMRWLLPDFLADQAELWGVRRDKMIIAHPGELLHVGPLTILPFMGQHFRPVTGKGTEEYGYHITTDDGLTMAFPVDTRDFSTDQLTSIPAADYCFANVWLGDHNGFASDLTEQLDTFANFMLHFSKKNILFAHLYECNRRAEDMWRDVHAEMLTKTIRGISPQTNTILPAPGEIMFFDK